MVATKCCSVLVASMFVRKCSNEVRLAAEFSPVGGAVVV